MRTIRLALAIIIAAASVSACTFVPPAVVNGSGRVISEARSVAGFSAVDLASLGNLVIEQKDTESLTIEGEDNIVAEITSEVKGGRLTIGARRDNVVLRPARPLIYHLTAKQLNAISLSGAGSVEAERLSATALAVNVSGAGNVTMKELTADSLNVNLSGVGNTMLSGKAARQNILVSGVGNYRGEALAGEQVTARTSGAGNVEVRVSGALDASISGLGSVRYWGSPRVTQTVSGLGSVTKAGE